MKEEEEIITPSPKAGDKALDLTESGSSSGGKYEAPTSLPITRNSKMLKAPAKNCYRLVVLGASKVGKTSLVSRFLNGKFDESYTPTIEDFHRKFYRIRGDVYQLDILDTSGNHPFPAMKRLSFLTGDLFILVFSYDSAKSWEDVIRLREQILETKACATNQVGGPRKKISPRVPMVIAGNKCDRETRSVSEDSVSEYVSCFPSCAFVNTSAKKNCNVDQLFYELFLLANLPMEMSPALHKKVTPSPLSFKMFGRGSTGGSSTSIGRYRGLSIRRRLSEAAYGMVTPDARRPSIRTDLLILRAKTSIRLNVVDAFREKKKSCTFRDASCVIQ